MSCTRRRIFKWSFKSESLKKEILQNKRVLSLVGISEGMWTKQYVLKVSPFPKG